MKLEGSITISRTTSNQGPDYIRVAIRDEQSSCTFVTAEIALADFAQAITGLGAIPCELDLRGLDKIGKRREHKTELLPRLETRNQFTANEQAKEAVKPYEVDGWIGEWRDLLNSNRWAKDGKCSVGFTRFVDVEED